MIDYASPSTQVLASEAYGLTLEIRFGHNDTWMAAMIVDKKNTKAEMRMAFEDLFESFWQVVRKNR